MSINYFGFRKNHSTTLALTDVTYDIYYSLDHNKTVVGIYLALQKAVDCVNHDILLYKMYNNYGVRVVAYKWFANYLTDRKQYTCVKDASSTLNNVNCCVPQGSVLGPLLFLVYVNDIASAVPGSKLKLFADDTNLFISGIDEAKLRKKYSTCLAALNSWFIANRLCINLDKTNYNDFSF